MLNNAEKLLHQGTPEQALPLLAEYCECHAGDARAWFLLGVCQHQTGKLEAALHTFECTISIEPRHLHARSAKAAVLSDLGQHREALHVYRKALHLAAPDQQPQLLVNMGVVMEQLGDERDALERYDQALGRHPGFTGALLNRGVLLIKLGRLEDGLANNRKLAELYPDWEHAQYNLGEALLALGKWEEALAAYERAMAVNPAAAKPHFARGLALSMLRRFDEAQHAFDTAKSLDPAAVEQCLHNAAWLPDGEIHEIAPKAIYLLKGTQRLDDCDWAGREEFVASFEYLIESSLGQVDEITERALAYRSLSLPISAATRLALAKSIASHIIETVEVERRPKFIHKIRHGGKLRIGYISPDFRFHPVGRLTRRLYGLHDRDRFEVFGYALSPEDGSDIRRDISQGCDIFRELGTMTDAAAATVIHADGIDILVDLSGYATNTRTGILACQPAPVQISYNGFPGSMGAPFIKYFITDKTCSPPGQEDQFAEKLVYLPGSCMIYNNREEVATHPVSRTESGLPERGFVFCCFNNSYKIEPIIFNIWMRVLKRTPNSVLWLPGKNEEMIKNLRREAELRGVPGSRLVFASFVPRVEEHLARYRLADLFLDTLHFNAITTAADALWAGLPVLSCPGSTFVSRWASSMLNAVGLDEMVAESLEHYEERACYFALHYEEIVRLKEKLAKNRLTMPLFDIERHVRNLETAYHTMWQRQADGQMPESFRVPG
ncbi:MAG TPA: tetratricopeptide repeat protein [Gallionella sp.]|jgi:predicted O-linked N-acetylglucosamine transferase (SPINDLY family)|nr:tetratricopeptide repeat protein [Gallionella sp.]